MKKILILGLFALVAVTLAGCSNSSLGSNDRAILSRIDLLGTKASQSSVLTTSTVVLQTGKSTGYVNLNISASSTIAKTVSFIPYWSNDAGCSSTTDSSIYWFQETTVGVSGTAVTLSAPATYSFSAVAGSNKFTLGFSNLSSECMKFDFYTNSSTVTTTMWAEAVTKSN